MALLSINLRQAVALILADLPWAVNSLTFAAEQKHHRKYGMDITYLIPKPGYYCFYKM